VLLFADEGFLPLVEVYGDGGEFAGVPDPASLKLSEWTPADEHGIRRLLNQ